MSLNPETFLKTAIVAIHYAIHDRNQRFVSIVTPELTIKKLKIKTSTKSNCRYVYWNSQTFMQQNKTKTSVYAKLAREGKKITWIMRDSSQWGLIIDGKIERS